MFAKNLIEKRVNRAIAALNEQNIDLWLSIGRETHMTSEPALLFLLPAGTGQLTAVCLYKTGDSIALLPTLYIEEMEQYGVHKENILYEGLEDFDQKLVGLIARVSKNGRIALNFSDGDTPADGLFLTQFRRIDRPPKQVGFEGELVSIQTLMKRTRA